MQVIYSTINEVVIESLLEDMIDKLTKELAYPLATHIYEEI